MNKRLILSLLMDNGILMNSHKFELNPICNVDTVRTYLNYESIDELIVLNVSRGIKNINAFALDLNRLTKNCFVPICAGGGIQSLSDCHILLENGADKVVINTKCLDDLTLLTQVTNEFGNQFLVCSLDVGKDPDEGYVIFSDNGSSRSSIKINDWLSMVEDSGAGEILLRAIHKDGTATGYDLSLIELVTSMTKLPVIVSGGFGEFIHVNQAIAAGADAISIGNMFHFFGERISNVRSYLHGEGIGSENSLWSFPSFGNTL